MLPHMRQGGEIITSVSAVHIILTPTQTVRSRYPLWESNPGPPHQESHALPTDLPGAPPPPPPPAGFSCNEACTHFLFPIFQTVVKDTK